MNQDEKVYPYPFKYSDVVSDNISVVPVDQVVRDWGGNVIVWGEPAAPDDMAGGFSLNTIRLQEKISRGRNLGSRLYIGAIFFLLHSMYHKYLAADQALQKAIIVDIEGLPLIPRWLEDHTFRGVPLYWNCTNNIVFEEFLCECVKAGIEVGYNGFCIEEPRGTAQSLGWGGCFCDCCMSKFRIWLKTHYDEQALLEKGIDDIEVFSYREMLHKQYKTKQAHLDAIASQVNLPLQQEYALFQEEAAQELIGRLKVYAQSLAKQEILFGMFGPDVNLFHPHADFYTTEVNIGPPKLGYRRITFAFEKTRAVKRPHGWTYFSPLAATYIKNKGTTNSVKAMIALSYAYGHHFGIPHYSWAYPKSTPVSWDVTGCGPYEIEASNCHYLLPTEHYLPYYRFVTQHAHFFDGYHALERVGLVYYHQSQRQDKALVEDIHWALMCAQVPSKLLVDHDEENNISNFTAPEIASLTHIILTKDTVLKETHQELLKSFQGQIVICEDASQMISALPTNDLLQSNESIWAKARINLSNEKMPLVIHLLNLNFEEASNQMIPVKMITVSISNNLLFEKSLQKVMVYAPEQEPYQAMVIRTQNGITVQIKELNYWCLLVPVFK